MKLARIVPVFCLLLAFVLLLPGCPLTRSSSSGGINPAEFTTQVTNRFFPLVPGMRWVYEAETEDGTEVTEVLVTDQTRVVVGVVCVVVRDTVRLDGEVIEDTFDWYAQDLQGNVWYFGEDSSTYENGVLVSKEGSWEAGVDGAEPGITMEADPKVGDFYRQEYLAGVAEDQAEVIALNQTVTVPFGNFTGCLQTEDTTPLEPDVAEQKYYAPGVGLVLEEDNEGVRTELVDFDQP